MVSRSQGAIANHVASERHADLLREGFARAAVPLLGLVRRDPEVALPSRHLGLVQAEEHADLARKIARAAGLVADGCDLDTILEAARAFSPPTPGRREQLAPPWPTYRHRPRRGVRLRLPAPPP
jgi:cobyrinic acid a,c-diamide synthase